MKRLFGNAQEGPLAYAAPFLDALCSVFSQLGEDYIDLLLGRSQANAAISRSALARAAKNALAACESQVDEDTLIAGLFRFFQETHPESATVKWNMAQNYFILRALGVDESAAMLSREAFGNTEAYLDTNVVIHALEPKARYHHSFESLSSACQGVGMELRVAQPTIEELRHVVDYQRVTTPMVAEQVPDEIAPRVRGLFFRLYWEELREKGKVDIKTLFKSFRKPGKRLRRLYGVETTDDKWFLDAQEQKEVVAFSKAVEELASKRRPYPKGRRSIIHDAILLRWVEMERERTGKTVYLVTLDSTLRSVKKPDGQGPSAPIVVNLDALLQWIWPATIHFHREAEAADIFSEALKYHLLPQETFFEERDFLMFNALQMQARNLPPEDVEECIRYLKAKAPGLDPSKPKDREKLARVLGGFFADPSRKHTQIVQEYARRVSELEGTVAELKQEIGWLGNVEKRRILRRRWGIALFSWALVESLAVWFAIVRGEGTGWLSKLGNLFYVPSLAFFFGIVMVWVVVGREQLRSLHWIIRKLFRVD